MTDLRVNFHDDGDVLTIAVEPDGVWSYSKFPHPLVTADYDTNGKLISITLVGAHESMLSESLLESVAAVIEDGSVNANLPGHNAIIPVTKVLEAICCKIDLLKAGNRA